MRCVEASLCCARLRSSPHPALDPRKPPEGARQHREGWGPGLSCWGTNFLPQFWLGLAPLSFQNQNCA